MIRRAIVLALVLSSLPALASTSGPQAAPARVVDGRVDDWRGATTGLGGTWQHSTGELVYQDHLFDDLGADTGARSQQHGTVQGPKGDTRYPDDQARYGNNAADLLELRVAADKSDVWLLARMSTLSAPDTTVVAIAVDTDDDAATGGGPLPHDAGLSVPGADVVVTLWGTGGTITTLPDGASTSVDEVAVEIDDAHNAIEAHVPRGVLGDRSTVRMWAVTGLWDTANTSWMAIPPSAPTATAPGGGGADVESRAFNVAFRADDTGSFMEDRQAAALAAGDIAPFHAEIDLDLLERRRSAPYVIEPGRFYAAVMDQRVSIPPWHEGVSYDGEPGRFGGAAGALAQTFNFFGRHQPYGVYIPSTYDGSTALPAALVLHGLGGSYSSFNSRPGFLADMGEGDGSPEQPPLLLVTPLGRGSSFYADWGEADTLAVLDDAAARFPMDPERLYISGYSMGGYGTYRLASLYPDRFAAAAVWAGYTGEFTGAYLTDPRALAGDPTGLHDEAAAIVQPAFGAAGVGGGRAGKANIGDPVQTMENLRHVPLLASSGTNDEIVPTSGQLAAPRRLTELGYRNRLDVYPGYEHFTFGIVDDWKRARAWLGNRTRTAVPREVTYRFSDGWTAPGLAAELGLAHDGAWWLRGLTMREPTEDGLVLASASATSWGIAAPATVVEQRDPTLVAEPTPHTEHEVAWSDGDALPVDNRLDLDLGGVGTATVDLDAAGLSACGLLLHVRTDGPVTIRLLDGRDEHVVAVAEPMDGDIVVECGRG